MTLARETARNALLMVAARTSSLVISIGSVFFYTRWFHTDELAFVTVLSVLAQSCVIFGDLGLGLAVDRRLPGLMESDPSTGRDLARTYLWTVCVVSVVLCLALWILAGPISRVFLDGAISPTLILWGIPYVVAMIGHQLLTVLLRGTRNYGMLSLCVPLNQIAWSVLSIGAYIGLARGAWPGVQAWFGADAPIKAFIFIQGVAQFPAIIIFSKPVWRLIAGLPSPGAGLHHLKMSLPYHAERYLNSIAAYGDQWVVAAFMSNEAKAIYYVPRTFFDRLTTTLDGITAVPLTALSTAAARNKDSLLRGIQVMRRALLYIFGFGGACLLVGSRLLVDILAGSKYHAGGVMPFRVLAVHFIVIGMFLIHQQAVNAAGKPGDRLRIILLQNIASLAALAILGWYLSRFGATAALCGVAAARIVGAAAGGWAASHYVRKIVPLKPDWTALRVVAIPCLTVISIVFIGQSIHYSGTLAASRLALGFTRLGLAITCVTLFLLRIMPESDLHNIEEVLPRRLNWALALGRWLRRGGKGPPIVVTPVVPTGLENPQLENISAARLEPNAQLSSARPPLSDGPA